MIDSPVLDHCQYSLDLTSQQFVVVMRDIDMMVGIQDSIDRWLQCLVHNHELQPVMLEGQESIAGLAKRVGCQPSLNLL